MSPSSTHLALGRSLLAASAFLRRKGLKLSGDLQHSRVIPWFEIKGDQTLRLFYALDPQSVVFDLGGYEGQWTSDIFSMYQCNIHVFEPVPAFHAQISRRFRHNPRIQTHCFWLAAQNQSLRIGLAGDGSSIFTAGAEQIVARFVCASDFMREHGVPHIDLMKLNIEGGEYDLLDHLIESGWIRRITDVQIQFHDCVPGATQRMHHIQDALKHTHHTTYQYPFVWENWHIKEQDRSR